MEKLSMKFKDWWSFTEWKYSNHCCYIVMELEKEIKWHTLPCYILGTYTGWYSLCFFFNLLLCKLFGHIEEDIGYAGPDSGRIHIICSRCGDTLANQIMY